MNGLKKLCLFTGIVLTLFSALFCVIGSIMGAGWSELFFTSTAGRAFEICIGLLIVAGLFEFREIYEAKWLLAAYLGALLVILAGFVNCNCTLLAGYAIGCISLFGLFHIKWSKADIATAGLLLFIIVFIFYSRIMSVSSHNLKSIFFVPHIFTCLLSYVFFAEAAFFAVKYLISGNPEAEEKSYKYVCIGFSFLSAGIVLGSIWAASAWGSWWSWDPKETFSLAVWLVIAAFLHFRYLYVRRFLRLNCFWVIISFALIILGITLVNFSRIFTGLHNYAG